jgi:hypothetical protein
MVTRFMIMNWKELAMKQSWPSLCTGGPEKDIETFSPDSR